MTCSRLLGNYRLSETLGCFSNLVVPPQVMPNRVTFPPVAVHAAVFAAAYYGIHVAQKAPK